MSADRSKVASMVAPALSGTLFGAGLAFGGMTDPARVIGFLDLFGRWDPTLAFFMAGAVAVMAAAWILRRTMARPLFAPAFSIPGTREIDRRLAVGALLFGIGWGIAGICPGPAIAALALDPLAILPFLAAMFAGMALQRVISLRPLTLAES